MGMRALIPKGGVDDESSVSEPLEGEPEETPGGLWKAAAANRAELWPPRTWSGEWGRSYQGRSLFGSERAKPVTFGRCCSALIVPGLLRGGRPGLRPVPDIRRVSEEVCRLVRDYL
ncbi:hypothetical protein NDU88_003503 [Pleurodeles waltl]|uniref:Uncharacterized protein n=1 Tax=Pleurodeles waltl TaxID=8319 RepID=A0AAV7PD15_PLEWA|nr:hypothetical protein NDU88_003503 [Pleurodeles waltl]